MSERDEVELILDPATGGVTFIHSDAAMGLAARVAGVPTITRASHVEPVPGTTSWEADLAPVGGPRLGPFTTRLAALDAEVAWLRANYLYCGACREAHDPDHGPANAGPGGDGPAHDCRA